MAVLALRTAASGRDVPRSELDQRGALAAEVDAGGRPVRVSSPDRVIYPATDRTPDITALTRLLA